MRILLSNDDGVFAPGLGTLARVLGENKEHEVYVCAPDRQRSATGHSLTLHKPLRVESVELEANVKHAWGCSGTPADCVKLAISELLKTTPPDVVVSGVNAGPNMGSDVLYSGTVAAAMEGAFLDVPSIAVSAQKGERAYFQIGAEFIDKLLATFKQVPWSKRGIINVNVPALPKDKIKGATIARLGVRQYNDTFQKRSDPMGRDYYWLSGHAIEEGEAEDSDVHAVKNGFISVTPVIFNMTDGDLVTKFETMNLLSGLVK